MVFVPVSSIAWVIEHVQGVLICSHLEHRLAVAQAAQHEDAIDLNWYKASTNALMMCSHL
jgi:hypothetical protein